MKKSKFDKVCQEIVGVSCRVLVVSVVFALVMLLLGISLQNVVFWQLFYGGAIIAMISAGVFIVAGGLGWSVNMVNRKGNNCK